jgi:hypothetical protein
MLPVRRFNLIRLHPQDDTLYVAQERTVFAAGLDGFIWSLTASFGERLVDALRSLLPGK